MRFNLKPLRSMRLAMFLTAALLPSGFVAAQPVQLELRPRVGDTLVLRIEQQTELIGTLMRGQRDSSVKIQTSMRMFARAIVQTSNASGATVLALTDSIRLSSTSEDAGELEAARRSLEGKRVYMKVLPDGSSELISGDAAMSNVLRTLIAEMPATLPKGAVEVGATWSRVVNLPLQQGSAPQLVRTTFKLDSLSRDKLLAYISMQGVLVEEKPAPALSGMGETSGNLDGRMTLDRKRGWIVDSVANIRIKAVVQKPMESRLPAVRYELLITQRMRTLNTK